MENPSAAFIGFSELNIPLEIIEKKCKEAQEKLTKLNIDLICTNIVRDDPKEIESEKAIKKLKRESFDFLIICIAGWIPSYPVIRILEEFSYKPILLWGLSGSYENGRLMTTAAQAGTSAIRKIMEDMNYNFKFLYNCPNLEPRMEEINKFAKASKTLNLLKHSKIGMMGFRDMNLYGTLYDGLSLKKKLGIEVEFFEMLEIIQKITKLDKNEVSGIINKIRKEWVFKHPVSDDILKKGVEFYLTIKEKIEERNYQAISLIDVDGMKKLINLPPAMVFMLLSDELGICTVPENDTLGSVTQLIMKYLTGQIAAYMELYEFMEDRILMAVPDYVPAEIVEGPVKVILAKFGNTSEGLLNISKVKTGRVTLSRLSSTGAKYTMHIVTGKAVEPSEWREIGWQHPAPQLPGLEIILDNKIEDFAEKVMSQHYIITYGDNTEVISDFCKLAKIEII